MRNMSTTQYNVHENYIRYRDIDKADTRLIKVTYARMAMKGEVNILYVVKSIGRSQLVLTTRENVADTLLRIL